jgi:hypothetical protein
MQNLGIRLESFENIWLGRKYALPKLFKGDYANAECLYCDRDVKEWPDGNIGRDLALDIGKKGPAGRRTANIKV